MRKRNPVVLIFIAAAVILGGLLILASARQATKVGPDAGPATTVPLGTVARPAGTTAATTAGAITSEAAATGAAARTTTTARSRPTTTTRPEASTSAPTAPKGMASIRVSALPAEARTTLGLIEAGGPFPYDQDGVVFQNREKVLPKKASSYYHEYTVVTPGSPDRGARRIITGGAGERYYTDDHYASFRFVVP